MSNPTIPLEARVAELERQVEERAAIDALDVDNNATLDQRYETLKGELQQLQVDFRRLVDLYNSHFHLHGNLPAVAYE